jgi:hypothetical protein
MADVIDFKEKFKQKPKPKEAEPEADAEMEEKAEPPPDGQDEDVGPESRIEEGMRWAGSHKACRHVDFLSFAGGRLFPHS